MKPAVAVFAKAPIPGHAKTRLGKELGMARAARVYERWLLAQLDHLQRSLGDWHQIIFAAEKRDASWFQGHAPDWELMRQHGDDLGARLRNAFALLFERSIERAVIVGADAPDLGAAHLLEASGALADHDLVLGPTHDGGYYLIGQRAPGVDVFAGVSWSTSTVLDQTLAAASEVDLRVHLLTPLRDIDTIEDWLRYRS